MRHASSCLVYALSEGRLLVTHRVKPMRQVINGPLVGRGEDLRQVVEGLRNLADTLESLEKRFEASA
jgi:hypothetical protein